MLASMRKLSKTWLFKGLMALLVISFGIWGIGDMFKGNPGLREVATVGKDKITVQMLQFEFQKMLPEARKQYGGELTAEDAVKLGLMEQALQIMIDRSALDQETADQGLVVSNEVILKRLAALPQFRDKDGKFNGPLFQQALGKAGLNEKTFFEMERRELARQLLLNAFGETQAPNTMIDNMYRARGAKRILEIVSIRNDAMQGFKQPDVEVMKAYYEEHKDAFVAPELRGFTIAAFSVPSLEKEVTVSDEEIRKSYAAQEASLTVPETRDLVQIVVQEQAKAEEIAAKAAEAKDLSKAAKAAGLTPITMSKIDDKAILPELYTNVFALEEGGVTGAMKSSLGYHVVQVKKIYPAGKPSFEAVKDELREGLRQQKLSERVSQTIKDWDDSIAAGTPLEEIADTLKLRLTRVAAADQFGHDPNGKKVDATPMGEKLIPLAFEQNQGDVGQIIDDGKDTYYVVRTDSVTPSQARPFDEVKNAVKAKIIEAEQAVLSAKLGAEIAEAMRKGKAATSFASRAGVEVRLSKPMSLLGDRDKSLSAAAVHQAFKMKSGDVTDMADEGVHLVLRMADIVPVDPARPEGSRLRVVDDLKRNVPYDIVGLFSSYTKQTHPVSINAKLLETLKTQGQGDK